MKLFLAPIQGMTIAPFRNNYARTFPGIDVYYSPFISTSNKQQLSEKLFKDILPSNNDSTINMVPQLLGNSGPDFKHYAKAIVALGYKEIDWNIGCPFPMVTKKKKGSGLLPYPDMINSFLDEVCSDSSYQLTVKMRLGLDTLEEGLQVISLLNDYPLKSVTIHARTGEQRYKGHANIDAFKQLASLSQHTLTYNGDIVSHTDFIKIQEALPTIDQFMIGRGALYNPFLASEIKGIPLSNTEKLLRLQDFHQSIFTYYSENLSGDKHLCDKMKEFWTYFSVNLDSTGKFIKKIKKCHSSSDYLKLTNNFFSKLTH